MLEISAVTITIVQTRPNPPATSKSEPTSNLQIRTHQQPPNQNPPATSKSKPTINLQIIFLMELVKNMDLRNPTFNQIEHF